jgi:hypothetical protein
VELNELWRDHQRDPFPRGCAGREIFGVDLVMLDADIAGLVSHVVGGTALSIDQRKILAKIRDELEFVVPNLPRRAQPYFARLAQIAGAL